MINGNAKNNKGNGESYDGGGKSNSGNDKSIDGNTEFNNGNGKSYYKLEDLYWKTIS
ncbi:hypothetical protein [Epilithonimonas sp.]|uniref:hypothetical protein n=1 Tax=Epilithonimonas sp. TaxID=2894511 RepID=UPI00289D53A1|nr:hypothetical protein [Epilithonimonas sp.]